MALSPEFAAQVQREVIRAHAILANKNSPQSLRTVARFVLAQHGSN